MRVIIILAFIGFLSCYSCSDKIKNEVIEIQASAKKPSINDTVYYKSVSSLEGLKRGVYVADKTARIFFINSSGEFEWEYAEKGKGPGELSYVSDLSSVNDSLYIYDRSQGKIIVLDNENDFRRDIITEDLKGARNMAVSEDGDIYVSTPFSEKPITVLNNNGNTLFKFGNKIADPSGFNVYRNEKLLQVTGNKVLALSSSDPLLEVYSEDGELLESKKIQHSEIQNRVDDINSSYSKPSPYGGYKLVVLFEDMKVVGNQVYLLTRTDAEGKTDNNFTLLLKYEMKKSGSLNFVKAIKLYGIDQVKRLSGTEIAFINENKVYLYDLSSKTIFVFEDDRI